MNELEQQLSKDQRSLLSAEKSILGSVDGEEDVVAYYINKILGVDKTLVRSFSSCCLLDSSTYDHSLCWKKGDETIHQLQCLPR